MSPAGSLLPLDMKDNMSRLVLSRCENWLFKQFASLCCCWTRQSRTGLAEHFWVECSVIQFVCTAICTANFDRLGEAKNTLEYSSNP